MRTEKDKKIKFKYTTKANGTNTAMTIRFYKDMSKYKVQLSDSQENLYNHNPVKNSRKVKELVFNLPGTVEVRKSNLLKIFGKKFRFSTNYNNC